MDELKTTNLEKKRSVSPLFAASIQKKLCKSWTRGQKQGGLRGAMPQTKIFFSIQWKTMRQKIVLHVRRFFLCIVHQKKIARLQRPSFRTWCETSEGETLSVEKKPENVLRCHQMVPSIRPTSPTSHRVDLVGFRPSVKESVSITPTLLQLPPRGLEV